MKPSKINIPKLLYNSERLAKSEFCSNNHTDRSDGTRNKQNQLNPLYSNTMTTSKVEQNKKEIHFYLIRNTEFLQI